jgi:hypothetical protein
LAQPSRIIPAAIRNTPPAAATSVCRPVNGSVLVPPVLPEVPDVASVVVAVSPGVVTHVVVLVPPAIEVEVEELEVDDDDVLEEAVVDDEDDVLEEAVVVEVALVGTHSVDEVSPVSVDDVDEEGVDELDEEELEEDDDELDEEELEEDEEDEEDVVVLVPPTVQVKPRESAEVATLLNVSWTSQKTVSGDPVDLTHMMPVSHVADVPDGTRSITDRFPLSMPVPQLIAGTLLGCPVGSVVPPPWTQYDPADVPAAA